MRSSAKYLVGLFGLLILSAMPVLAGSLSTDFVTATTVTFGTTQLQPGDYLIRGKESEPQLEILEHGKVIATVPCKWVPLDKKAQDSKIISNDNRVTEVQFQGRKEAAEVGS